MDNKDYAAAASDGGLPEVEPQPEPATSIQEGNNYGEGEQPAGITFEEEDAYLEQDPDEAVQEFAQNPMMDRVQAALYNQLKRTHDRVMTEVLDKEESLRNVKKDREECGVQLYGMQQQLAKLQMTLEQAHARFNDVSDKKGDNESNIAKLKDTHLAEKVALDEVRKQVVKNQSELDALNETIHQVKAYNEEMKGEIAVTRRATYKAEENVKDLETAKQSQDLYIDSLNERIKNLHADISLSEAQLEAQLMQVRRRQTQVANPVLLENPAPARCCCSRLAMAAQSARNSYCF